MLNESAKYLLHMMLFNQNLADLPKDVQIGLSACPTRCVFAGSNFKEAKWLLEASEQSYEAEDPDEDFARVMKQAKRHFVLQRPEHRLEHTVAPWVHEYKMDKEETQAYIDGLTKDFMTHDEVKTELAKIADSLETEETSSQDETAKPKEKNADGDLPEALQPDIEDAGEVFDPYHE